MDMPLLLSDEGCQPAKVDFVFQASVFDRIPFLILSHFDFLNF
jgi:hypothetical protein